MCEVMNDIALSQNAGKIVELELIFSLCGNVLTKATYRGVLREKPTKINEYGPTRIYGIKTSNSFVVLDLTSARGGNVVRVLSDYTDRVPKLTIIQTKE
jgi:hypothetical protein